MINQGNARARVFHKAGDYKAFFGDHGGGLGTDALADHGLARDAQTIFAAGLVGRAEKSRWSSLARVGEPAALAASPVSITRNGAWLDSVNSPMADEKLAKLRESIRRDRSLGSDEWVERTP